MPGHPRQRRSIDPIRSTTAFGWPPGLVDIERAAHGDRTALHEILAAGYPKLASFYRGLGLNRSDAEDLAADACEAIVGGLGRLRDPAAFEAWFWAIGRNRFRGMLRRKRRDSVVEPMTVPAELPGDRLEAAEDHSEIRRALERVSPRDRELLWLREVVGLTYDEIANRHAVAAGTVRVSLHRARRRLEKAYREVSGPDS